MAVLLVYLGAERLRLERSRRRVPRRVAVTGTRGKSSVVRLVAAGFRASGARVLAKTTGSRPLLILPDGSEREIGRSGPASIREQVRLVGLAAALGADTLVAEMMSIGAEGLAVESRRILRPGALAVTNVRLDHLDDMGRDKDAIARTLAAAVPDGADVFIPAEEVRPALADAAAARGSRWRPVMPIVAGAPDHASGPELPLGEFESNRRLARAILASFGVDRAAIEEGLAGAAPDPGHLGVWRVPCGRAGREALCVSLFAANEPESSAAALGAVRRSVPLQGRPLVGLVCLRDDRGDRTLQWIEAARAGFFVDFAALAFVGAPARAALRRLRKRPGAGPPVRAAFGRRDAADPEALMGRLMPLVEGEPVVVGLGNFVGPGDALVEYWKRAGVAHGR